MLQWTREGQETLQVARRQHNGGIECFRKKDFAASKRFLQNALAIRKTVLSHSHPIILGTIEMLSIVSELSQTAMKPGCAVQHSLFPTAEEPAMVHTEADDRALITGVATIQQLARLRMRNDPEINERFNPASPSFTLFKNADGVTIDPCLVEQYMNKEELKMILWELFYLQQLRLGPYHVDTQLTLTRLWEVATEMGDSVLAEALGKRIWEIRCSSPGDRRAVAMAIALGHPGGLPSTAATSDVVPPPAVHPSALLFARPPSPPPQPALTITASGRYAAGSQQQNAANTAAENGQFSDFDFTLSNLERRQNTGPYRASPAHGRPSGAGGSAEGGGVSSGGGGESGASGASLGNYYAVRPKMERRIPLLEDDSWEAALRRQLGADKGVDELLRDSAAAVEREARGGIC